MSSLLCQHLGLDAKVDVDSGSGSKPRRPRWFAQTKRNADVDVRFNWTRSLVLVKNDEDEDPEVAGQEQDP